MTALQGSVKENASRDNLNGKPKYTLHVLNISYNKQGKTPEQTIKIHLSYLCNSVFTIISFSDDIINIIYYNYN